MQIEKRHCNAIYGYIQSQGYHTLLIKHFKLRGVITLLIYVDDLIVIGNDEGEKVVLKQSLTREFEIKVFGK